MTNNDNRQKTPVYLFFYLLFSPDTWRILMGGLLAWLITPGLVREDMSAAAVAMLYAMIACIGWAVSGKPATWITRALKKRILQRR